MSGPGNIAKRESQIASALGELSKATELLHNSMSQAEEVFSGVTREASPGKVTDTAEKAPELQLVPIADQIRHIVERIRYANERVQSLIDRCEL